MTQQFLTFTINSETDTKQLAEQLASVPLSGSVWLSGDLGAGKTTLTRYWLQAMGHQGAVKSPTYTLVEPYQIVQDLQDDNLSKQGDMLKPVYHADLYRLKDAEELDFIGFDEYLAEPNALVIIEWASRALHYLPTPIMEMTITRVGEARQIDLVINSLTESTKALYMLLKNQLK